MSIVFIYIGTTMKDIIFRWRFDSMMDIWNIIICLAIETNSGQYNIKRSKAFMYISESGQVVLQLLPLTGHWCAKDDLTEILNLV